jgi:Mrp family chromosome partitioning ATPase
VTIDIRVVKGIRFGWPHAANHPRTDGASDATSSRFRVAGGAAGKSLRPDFAEAYRMLALQVQQRATTQQLRTLLVMSAYRGDGRTTVAANLGVALTELGLRVVLVESDTRRPALAALFPEMSDAPASTSDDRMGPMGLVPITEADLVVWRPQTLQVSPPRPVDVKAVIEAARSAVDIVILDSPPCLRYADAFSVAPLVDGVLFVIRRRAQSVDAQRTVQEQLGQLGAKVLGVVYNEV